MANLPQPARLAASARIQSWNPDGLWGYPRQASILLAVSIHNTCIVLINTVLLLSCAAIVVLHWMQAANRTHQSDFVRRIPSRSFLV